MKVIIHTKRVYETAAPGDGYRILVDRLWPRGIRKEELVLDEWAKDLAPSSALRKWFDHQTERFPEFTERYKAELDSNPDALERILGIAARQPLTLLYAARNTELNQAKVLQEVLEDMISRQGNQRQEQ